MTSLKKKMKKEGGFTLVEMLIVVAIIAILIAVSIPMVNGALDKARKATDAANERSAKAAALIMYVSGEINASSNYDYVYDAANGTIVPATSGDVAKMKYGKCDAHKQQHLLVKIVAEVKDNAGNITTASDVSVKWSGSDTLDSSDLVNGK